MKNEWKVGDRVAAPIGMSRNSIVARKVERVLKRFIELNDGSQWTHTGHSYPHVRYSTRFIRPMTDELEAQISCQRAIRFLEKTEWAKVGPDTTKQIVAILNAEKAQAAPGSGKDER
jgi:hypothetical protein